MEMERIDLSLICRTCKCVSSSMRSLFSGLKNENISPHNPRIDKMLMACAAVQISFGDGLPSLMCEMCCESLKSAFQFKKQCETVDASLREYCKTMKVNAIKQELQNSEFMESFNTLSNLLNSNNESQSTTKETPKEVTALIETEASTSARTEENEKPIVHPETDFIQFLDNNQLLLTCRECSKVFTTLEGLRCHKRVHSGTTFKCKQCDKEYTRKNHLERHEAYHSKRIVHVCKVCNKTLTRMEHLKRHLITHLREKPFNCDTCNRGFNRIEHLHNHKPRCKGENVHICPVCNKAFYREDSLEVHKELHDSSQLALPTIESLDNIEQHYFQVDYDSNITFSDNSDVEDCFEPQVEVTESGSDTKLDMSQDAGEQSAAEDSNSQNLMGQDNTKKPKQTPEIFVLTCDGQDNAKQANKPSEDPKRTVEAQQDQDDDDEKPLADLVAIVKSEEAPLDYPIDNDDDLDDDNDAGLSANSGRDIDFDQIGHDIGSSGETSDEDYVPQKESQTPNGKRRRGRPRIHPPKPKGLGKGRRGRPPGSKKKLPAEEEIGVYPCPVCNEFYDKISLLDKHAKEAHPGLKIHKCNICGKEFNRPNHLRRHLTSHSEEKSYTCDICTKGFVRRDHLMQHKKLHEQQEDIPCDICAKVFSKADLLAKHKASKHGIGEKILITGEKKYQCEVCQKGFTTEKYRDVHMKAHNGEKQFQCKVCEKMFLSKSHLTEHMKFHNEHSKKFLCSECGQRFIRNDYLVIHMRRHRGEKPFKCKFCGKGFPRTTDLTVHERYHTGEKTHLCTVCGRGFGRAYNLTVHMRTHTGEKPYQCTYCDAAFAQGNDLKAHIRRHTGERFQCDLCTESFLMGYLLTHHKRTVHGLNVVSNIRRLQPVHKTENPDDPPPITIPLPKPVIPETLMFNHLLQPTHTPLQAKEEKPDDSPSLSMPFSKTVMPENLMFNHLQAQLSISQMHFSAQRPAT